MLTDYLEGQESVDYSGNKFIAHVTSLWSLIKGPDISFRMIRPAGTRSRCQTDTRGQIGPITADNNDLGYCASCSLSISSIFNETEQCQQLAVALNLSLHIWVWEGNMTQARKICIWVVPQRTLFEATRPFFLSTPFHCIRYAEFRSAVRSIVVL